MKNRQRMTHQQRAHHYQQWRDSGMNKTQYAKHHGINVKTFFGLCGQLAPARPASTTSSPATPATNAAFASTPTP